MYFPSLFKNHSLSEITEQLQQEGWKPVTFNDPPGYEYARHTHPETKLLVFLEGSMCVTIDNQHYTCHKGDKLIIDAHVPHSAKVNKEGCTFLWAEKMV